MNKIKTTYIDRFFKKHSAATLLFVLLLALLLRLVQLNQSFWLDEAAQVIESARPLSQQLQIEGDFQPPLFHVLLHAWMYGGHEEAWVRLLPVAFGVATVYVAYLLGRHVNGNTFGLLAAFFVAIAPFHLWYSQEVRPYALAGLLGVLATYMLIRRRYVWYFIVGLLFLHSVYTAVFLLFAHAVWVWRYRRGDLRSFILAAAGMAVAFVPWLPSFLTQLRIGTGLTQSLPGWTTAVSTTAAKSLPLIFAKFSFGRITFDNKLLYAGLLAAAFAGFLYLLWRAWQQKKDLVVQLLIFFAVPILLSFVVSLFIPILAPQRVLFTLPFFFALVAAGIHTLGTKTLPVAVSAVMLISSFGTALYYTNPRFQREQWRQAVAYVERSAVSDSLVLFVFPEPFAPWQWYQTDQVEAVGIAPQFVLRNQDIAKVALRIDTQQKIFLFQYLSELTDPQQKMMQYLEQEGFVQSDVRDFPGVGFVYTYEKFFAQN